MSTNKTFLLATNNPNKVAEIRQLLPAGLDVKSLEDAGIRIDIPEPYDTLEENARTKSETIYKYSGINCFAEDTGLEVTALNGEPGVRSARYAGDEADSQQNIDLVLSKLSGIGNRKARFRTVISLIIDGKETQFEGICDGEIHTDPRGENGFGYDPIFIPTGASHSFAEMTMEEKSKYSHRKKATFKLLEFLKTWNDSENKN